MMIRNLLIAATALSLLTGPALAQQTQSKAKAEKAQKVDRGKNSVWCGGEYLGSDPDPRVRLQILRDYKGECR